VTNPLFWLVLSLLFVTISLAVMLLVMIPTLRELARAARSAEKLFETLRREFPPTLEAIRLTGMEISDLTDDISEGVQSAGQVAKQVDQTISGARKQVRKVQLGARSVVTGVKTAWRTFTRPQPPQRRVDRLPASRHGTESLDMERDRTEPRRVMSEEASSQSPDNSIPPSSYQSDANGTRFISKSGEVMEDMQYLEAETAPDPVEEWESQRREL